MRDRITGIFFFAIASSVAPGFLTPARISLTLCFSANQALLAAKAGATFVSPFIGRLDDIGLNGMDVIREIRTIFDNYGCYCDEIV